jgi:hypothetical protein
MIFIVKWKKRKNPTYGQIKNVNSKINQKKRKAYGKNVRPGNPDPSYITTDVARIQDLLADWLSVVTWLWLDRYHCLQQSLYCCVCVCCHSNMFSEPLPSNGCLAAFLWLRCSRFKASCHSIHDVSISCMCHSTPNFAFYLNSSKNLVNKDELPLSLKMMLRYTVTCNSTLICK